MYKDKQGRYLTQSLFYELSYSNPKWAIYTLKDEDLEVGGKTYVSIKRLYLEIADPTEYEFACQCFHGWEHWQRILSTTTVLHEHIESWREELEVKLRSRGVRRMIDESYSDSKTAASAAKWLVEKGWAEPRKAGRPSKQEVEGERKKQAHIKDQLASDLERITQH